MNTCENEIVLSIIVPTYNHEDYIVEALNSIKAQQTKYKFEVLVGEDKSTDKTREILKKYELDNPGLLKVFYRDENMSKLPIGNFMDLRYRARGKYLITLEGDDFWIDEKKIEKQIMFLESHPDAVAVSHKCVVVGQDSKPNGEIYPECSNNVYTVEDFENEVLPGQTTTIMTKNYIKDPTIDWSILTKRLSPGDRLIAYMLLTHGKVYCLDETMSAYRHVKKGGSSYSANLKYKFDTDERWWRELMGYALKHDSLAMGYIEYKYLLTLLRGIRYKDISLREFCNKYNLIHHKAIAFVKLIKYNVFR